MSTSHGDVRNEHLNIALSNCNKQQNNRNQLLSYRNVAAAKNKEKQDKVITKEKKTTKRKIDRSSSETQSELQLGSEDNSFNLIMTRNVSAAVRITNYIFTKKIDDWIQCVVYMGWPHE